MAQLEHPHRVHTGACELLKPLRSEETVLIHALFGIQGSTLAGCKRKDTLLNLNSIRLCSRQKNGSGNILSASPALPEESVEERKEKALGFPVCC